MNIVIDIRRFVNTALAYKIEPFLYVSDDPNEIKRLSESGHIVVPVLAEANRDEDFSSYKYVITNPEEVDDDYYYKIWLRYARLPWEILTTDRCIVREMTEKDVRALYEVYKDDSVTKYTEPLFPDLEDELTYTRNYIENVYSYFGFGTWVIVNKEDGKIIGRAGFNYRDGYEEPELGYVIGKEYQNKGFATEVCSAIIKYGYEELGFDSVSAFSHRDNIPSCKLLNNLGFEKVKEGIEVSFVNNEDKMILDQYISKNN